MKTSPPEESSGKDWRSVVGMFADSEFMRQVDEEGRKIREAERAAARQQPAAESSTSTRAPLDPAGES